MDDIEEVWKEISDYPRYAVSNLGRVMNVRTEELVKPQLNPQGVQYVPLYESDNRSSTRSIKVLVANAFVDNPYDPKIFETPVNKDGDKSNNRAENLVWRPLWFAVKYSHQFSGERNPIADEGPVYDLGSGIEYDTVFTVGVTFGLIWRDIYSAKYAERPVFPTQQVFRIPNTIHVR